MIRGIWSSIPAAVACALLATGCGDSAADSTELTTCISPPSSGFHPAAPLDPAKTRRLKAIVRRDRNVRRITAGRHLSIPEVIPWTSAGATRFIGAWIEIYLRPPTRLTDERLPTTISPNERAPLGTPILCGHALVSASNVNRLSAQVDLAQERVVSLLPEGSQAQITKEELIGSPPDDPAYQPEPGY